MKMLKQVCMDSYSTNILAVINLAPAVTCMQHMYTERGNSFNHIDT